MNKIWRLGLAAPDLEKGMAEVATLLATPEAG